MQIGPALVELVQPNVPEDDAAALPAATAVEGDGVAAMNRWDADPEGEADVEPAAGKGRVDLKAQKAAKKLAKQHAKQLQKEAAAALQAAATAAISTGERRALGKASEPAGEASKAMKAGAVAPAGGADEQGSAPSRKKAKKTPTAALSKHLAPLASAKPAVDMNRWDADPEAAEAADVGVPEVNGSLMSAAVAVEPAKATKAAHAAKAGMPVGSLKKKHNEKGAERASAAAAAPSEAAPLAAVAPAPATLDINRWDADPEALEDRGLDALGTATPSLDTHPAASHDATLWTGATGGAHAGLTANGGTRKLKAGKQGARAVLRPVAGVSGDDLGDEFDIEIEDEGEGGPKKKKKAKQAGRRSTGSGGDAALPVPAWEADAGPMTKQMKQVVF